MPMRISFIFLKLLNELLAGTLTWFYLLLLTKGLPFFIGGGGSSLYNLVSNQLFRLETAEE